VGTKTSYTLASVMRVNCVVHRRLNQDLYVHRNSAMTMYVPNGPASDGPTWEVNCWRMLACDGIFCHCSVSKRPFHNCTSHEFSELHNFIQNCIVCIEPHTIKAWNTITLTDHAGLVILCSMTPEDSSHGTYDSGLLGFGRYAAVTPTPDQQSI